MPSRLHAFGTILASIGIGQLLSIYFPDLYTLNAAVVSIFVGFCICVCATLVN
jgi:hypothetical protein